MGQPSSAGARFRQRKISVKQTLQILKQKDIPDLDTEEQQRELQKIETGVEKGEEEEHHLQAVINASKAKFKGVKVEQVFIPTPDASKIWKDAAKYYHQKFTPPASYIKFSATVEDTAGCPYNMDENDEEFLNKFNENKPSDQQCSEDEFELVAYRLESVVNEKQPFLSMDPHQILSLKEIKQIALFHNSTDPSDVAHALENQLHLNSFRTLLDAEPSSGHEPRPLAKLFDLFGEPIYEHWKRRRIDREGKPVFPALKLEDPSQKDDNNPYVCFRRREFRQARKTRRTDTQSIEKLKLFYKDMRKAKDLLFKVTEREIRRKEHLQVEREVFDLRCKLKKIKREEGIKADDDDVLVAQKKKKVIPPQSSNSPSITLTLGDKDIKEKQKDKYNKNDQLSQHSQKGLKDSKKARNEHKNIQRQQQQLQQSQNNANQVSVQPYVKLPSSKIPDLDLTTVNTVLKDKLEGIKKAVSDKLIKRKAQDEGWVNFTDDPYNPYFEMTSNNEEQLEQRTHLPYSSIVSSMYEIENSREIDFSYVFNKSKHYNNNDNDIVKINAATGQSIRNDRHNYLPEFYDLAGEDNFSNDYALTNDEINKKFNDKNRLGVSEVLFKLRKRHGRNGRLWIDRKRIKDDPLFDEFLNVPSDDEDLFDKPEPMDIDQDSESPDKLKEVEVSDSKRRKIINVYDSKEDARRRLKSRFLYDADLPQMTPLDPSKLNQIGKQTQAIRFGCMLLSKAYDNMHQIRQKQILLHQQKQAQQALLQQQQRENKKDMSTGIVSNGSVDSEKDGKSAKSKEKKNKKDSNEGSKKGKVSKKSSVSKNSGNEIKTATVDTTIKVKSDVESNGIEKENNNDGKLVGNTNV